MQISKRFGKQVLKCSGKGRKVRFAFTFPEIQAVPGVTPPGIMKAPPTHLVRLKSLYTFECPPLDYSILLGPQLQISRLTPGGLRFSQKSRKYPSRPQPPGEPKSRMMVNGPGAEPLLCLLLARALALALAAAQI
jgi:hypothetical protein